jgi:TRAP-type mannitol/chloroaromatic compound transport system permease small subunit
MRALNAFDRALGAAIIVFNCAGSLLVFVMTLAVVADVTGRYVLNSPINGTAEMVTMAVVVVLYLQLAYTLRSGRMTRSDSFYLRLLARRPKVGNAMGFLFNLAGTCLAGIGDGWTSLPRSDAAGRWQAADAEFGAGALEAEEVFEQRRLVPVEELRERQVQRTTPGRGQWEDALRRATTAACEQQIRDRFGLPTLSFD